MFWCMYGCACIQICVLLLLVYIIMHSRSSCLAFLILTGFPPEKKFVQGEARGESHARAPKF